MKRKKKYIIIAVLCLTAILGLIACLYAFGFRITYAPELENSWNAISACAAWAGVVISFVAIMFAIWVPIRIANRQDKIALFEKRFECYIKVLDFLDLASRLKKVDSVDKVIFCYQTILNGKTGVLEKITNESALADIIKADTILLSGGFLFNTYDVDLWEAVLDVLCHLMLSLNKRCPQYCDGKLTDEELEYKDKFCCLCEKFKNEYLVLLEQEMDLKKN